ncbi:MAG: lyase family protein [Planctomycetota bacterium]
MSGRLWDKGESVDDRVLAFCVGDDHLLDARLVPHDVRASIAHATMLHERGFLTADELDALRATLTALEAEHFRGEWAIAMEEEDVHTALESRLTERLGDLGGKIHLGRSRNDQVLVALRLYLREVVTELSEGFESVAAALEGLRDRQGEVALPGYTHTQRAMPSTVALWCLGHAAELRDDASAILGVLRRLSRCPLGSAAGYGTPGLAISRERTAELLGFDGPQEPVTAVQLSRGKAEAALLFELATGLGDIARVAADVVLFATSEFGFLRLPHAFTTGSSIMPQKRNPDVFELLRGEATQATADLQAALALRLGLGSGYHRDLQLPEGAALPRHRPAARCLDVAAPAPAALEFVPERSAAMDAPLFATERAYQLVKEEG